MISLDLSVADYDAAVAAKEAAEVAKRGGPPGSRNGHCYVVEYIDRSGSAWGERRAWTFEAIVEMGVELMKKAAGNLDGVLSFHSLERCDVDTDGLTEEETERLP